MNGGSQLKQRPQDLDIDLITQPNPEQAPQAVEKKSAAARMARGLGIKRDRESQKSNKSNQSGGSDSYVPPSHNVNVISSRSPRHLRLDRVPEDDWMQHEEDEVAAATYYYDDYPSDDEDDYSRKSVPIWLSLCLVIAYIVWGAFIFKVGKKERRVSNSLVRSMNKQ